MALAVTLLLKGRRDEVYFSFALTCFFIFLWRFCSFVWLITSAVIWLKLMALFLSLSTVALLRFLMVLFELPVDSPLSLNLSRTGYAFVCLSVLFLFFPGTAYVRYLYDVIKVYTLLALFFLIGRISRQLAVHGSAIGKERFRYLSWGGSIAIILGLTNAFHEVGVNVPPLFNSALALSIYFVYLTIVSYRIPDLKEIMGKAMVYSILVGIISAIYGTLVLGLGKKMELGIFNTFLASFVILVLLDSLKAGIERLMASFFFKSKKELVDRMNALSRRLSGAVELESLVKMVLEEFKGTNRISCAAIYLMNGDKKLCLAGNFDRGDKHGSFPEEIRDRQFVEAVSEYQKPFSLEEFVRRARQGANENEVLEKFLRETGVELCIPVFQNEELRGMILLTTMSSAESFSREEITILNYLANHIADRIESIALYEKMKDKDRLAVLGEMAAGLAHEIKNPLGAIKAAVQCLTPSSSPGKGQETEMMQVIKEEVERLDGVVSRFLDFARPYKVRLAPTEIVKMVYSAVQFVQNSSNKEIQWVLDLDGSIQQADLDGEAIRQVIINLLVNAVEAVGKQGKVTAGAYRSGNELCIYVEDNGPGIPGENLRKLFFPFFTTKEKGMGLGLTLCQRIVEAHGGKIEVESRPGKGSKFSIILPVKAKTGE